MYSILLLISSLMVFVEATSPVLPKPPKTIECGCNEVVTNCYNSCQPTCKNRFRGDDRVCHTACLQTGCVCKPDTLRHDNGTCVPVNECSPPRCNKDEVYLRCGTACEERCDNRGNNCTVCTEQCVEGCFCPEGTVRADNGSCVSPKTCPEPVCSGPNEQFDWCPPTCPHENCSLIWSRIDCTNAIQCCKPQCRCKPGYLRKNGVCVTGAECIGKTPECGPNAHWNSCGTACPLTCDEPLLRPCTKQCNPSCQCDDGYIQDENGNCIKLEECPKPTNCTGPNEVLSNCYTPCQRTCSNRFRGDGRVCHTACIDTGCVCKEGTLRHDNGTCVPIADCSTPRCNADEVYLECGSACEQTCDNRGDNCTACTLQCVEGCFCPQGTVRAANGSCILPDQCPKPVCSGPNEYFDWCPPNCPHQNCSAIWSRIDCRNASTCCKPQCRCIDGHYRNDSGICISTQECIDGPNPQCGKNAHFNNCGTACPLTCEEPYQRPCTRQCIRGCECDDTFVKDANGNCIKWDECPKPSCAANQTYVFCNAGCPTDYCKESNGPDPQCSPPNPCPPGCRCKGGYKKSRDDGRCILESDCPAPVICAENEYFTTCGTACPATCDNPKPEICTDNCVRGCFCQTGLVRDKKSGKCIPLKECPIKPTCPVNETYVQCQFNCPTDYCKESDGPVPQCLPPYPCPPGCRCLPGYLKRRIDGKCIKSSDCPPPIVCPKNEHFESCGTACPKSCDNLDPQICTLQCVRGCFCDTGLVRDKKTGQCVSPNQCSKEPTCPTNEHYEDCGTACPKTCDNPDPQICTEQCVQGCFCDTGLVRNKTGNCVPQNQCPTEPKCPKNEHYESCGTACPNTCDNPDPKICTLQCVQGCFCDKGLVRNKETGKCVPQKQCPIKCKANEELKKCRITCPPQTCASIYSTYDCTNVTQCEPGCDCINGYMRNGTESDPCIPSDKCPPPTPTCPNDNEEWRSCGSACPPTCQERNRTCIQVCKEGCFCKGDLVRNDKGICVPPKQCPVKVCPINEEWKSCGTACPKTCKNKDIKINCIAVCKSGCFCKGNRVRNDKGVCVLPTQCPKNNQSSECPPNEVWKDCGSACPPTCSSRPGLLCPAVCKQGCFCAGNLVRGPNGTCIPRSQCSNQKCPVNEVWLECGSACPETCTSQPNMACPAVCRQGCFCAGKLVRGPNGKCIPKSQCPKTTSTTTTTTTTEEPVTGCS